MLTLRLDSLREGLARSLRKPLRQTLNYLRLPQRRPGEAARGKVAGGPAGLAGSAYPQPPEEVGLGLALE